MSKKEKEIFVHTHIGRVQLCNLPPEQLRDLQKQFKYISDNLKMFAPGGCRRRHFSHLWVMYSNIAQYPNDSQIRTYVLLLGISYYVLLTRVK